MTRKDLLGAALLGAALSIAADSGVSRAQAPSPTAIPVALNSCPSGREIEYDATIQKCGVRYRWNNSDWVTWDPQGNTSCRSKTVRLRECLP